MKKHEDAFEKFETLARSVVNVPHSVVKAKLDEEKRVRVKRKGAKKHSSREASDSA